MAVPRAYLRCRGNTNRSRDISCPCRYFADTTHKTGEEADYATWQLNNYWCTLNADDTPKNPPKKKTLTNTAALSGDGGAQAAEAVETAGSAQPMDARACTAEAAAIVVVNNTMATNPSDGVWGGQPARKYRR